MEGKGTPKNEQNQFCHSPSVKAMTPSEVERQDSHAAIDLAHSLVFVLAGNRNWRGYSLPPPPGSSTRAGSHREPARLLHAIVTP